MLRSTTNINVNTHQAKFFKTHSEYILACIPKCGSSYYAWSILTKQHPSASKLLELGGENIRLLNNKDALSLTRYILKEELHDEKIILPFRDPLNRFLSIFLYLQDISEEEILGGKVDEEITRIVIESKNNQNIFFDYFMDSWEKFSIAIPQHYYYNNNTTLIPYSNTKQICKLINSVYIPTVINKGIGDSSAVTLTESQINKIKEIYKEDYKLKQCVS